VALRGGPNDMGKPLEFDMNCLKYRPWEDGKGSTALIELLTKPMGHAIEIGDIELIRTPPRGEDSWVKPIWWVRYPDHVIPEYSKQEALKDAILAAVARYQKENLEAATQHQKENGGPK
jgi:pyocin large subunit-like protein